MQTSPVQGFPRTLVHLQSERVGKIAPSIASSTARARSGGLKWQCLFFRLGNPRRFPVDNSRSNCSFRRRLEQERHQNMDQRKVCLAKNNTQEISVSVIPVTICLNGATNKKGFLLCSVGADDYQGLLPKVSCHPQCGKYCRLWKHNQIGTLSPVYRGKRGIEAACEALLLGLKAGHANARGSAWP